MDSIVKLGSVERKREIPSERSKKYNFRIRDMESLINNSMNELAYIQIEIAKNLCCVFLEIQLRKKKLYFAQYNH